MESISIKSDERGTILFTNRLCYTELMAIINKLGDTPSTKKGLDYNGTIQWSGINSFVDLSYTVEDWKFLGIDVIDLVKKQHPERAAFLDELSTRLDSIPL